MCFAVYFGLAVSASVRVGNLLGSGDAEGAALASRVALICGVILSLPIALAWALARYTLVRLYTSEDAVVEYAISHSKQALFVPWNFKLLMSDLCFLCMIIEWPLVHSWYGVG
jgi:Na+-driven multidrug efflux pump